MLAMKTDQTSACLHRAPLAFIQAALVLGALDLCGCKSAKVTGERDFGSDLKNAPEIVYVCDFDLLGKDIQHEDGVASSLPGRAGEIAQRVSGVSPDREARAREIVDLMASTLVKDLEKAGLKAARLRPSPRSFSISHSLVFTRPRGRFRHADTSPFSARCSRA